MELNGTHNIFHDLKIYKNGRLIKHLMNGGKKFSGLPREVDNYSVKTLFKIFEVKKCQS